MTIQNNWDILKEWFGTNAAVLLKGIPNSEPVNFKELENEIGIVLPDTFKQSYKMYNGQKGSTMRLFPFGILLTTHQILKEWRTFKKLAREGVFDNVRSESKGDSIKQDWYNLKWLPFCSNEGGDFLCIDFDPAESGSIGQVICFWHDSPDRQLIAKSFEDWFGKTINDFQNDIYIFNESYGTFELNK